MTPQALVALFKGIPPNWAVLGMACLPLAELRLSIPVALCAYKMSPLTAYLLSVTGNMLPIVPILLLFRPVHRFLERWSLFKRFFDWQFARVAKYGDRFTRWGAFALVSFVAIPLPMTGAWTGALAAFVFDVPKKWAFVLLLLGVMIAGGIVTALTLSGVMAVEVVAR